MNQDNDLLQKCYEQATKESLAESSTETRMDIIFRAMKIYSKEEAKSSLSWLMDKTEQCSDRYMEAESFILELAEMKWYQRIFCVKKILNFITSRSKYKF